LLESFYRSIQQQQNFLPGKSRNVYNLRYPRLMMSMIPFPMNIENASHIHH